MTSVELDENDVVNVTGAADRSEHLLSHRNPCVQNLYMNEWILNSSFLSRQVITSILWPCGLWQHAVLQESSNISEEHTAPIFTVEVSRVGMRTVTPNISCSKLQNQNLNTHFLENLKTYVIIFLIFSFELGSVCSFPWRYSPNFGLGLLPWNPPFHFGFLDLRHSVGLLGRVISSSQGLYLYTNTEKRTHTNTKYRCPEWDSNPRSRFSSERRQCMP
jgi:hypothetical protein